jgi:hypothetical protein
MRPFPEAEAASGKERVNAAHFRVFVYLGLLRPNRSRLGVGRDGILTFSLPPLPPTWPGPTALEGFVLLLLFLEEQSAVLRRFEVFYCLGAMIYIWAFRWKILGECIKFYNVIYLYWKLL